MQEALPIFIPPPVSKDSGFSNGTEVLQAYSKGSALTGTAAVGVGIGAAVVAEVGLATIGTIAVEGATAEFGYGGAALGGSAALARNGKVGELITKAGEVFTGFSKKAARSADVTRAANPTVQTALDAVPVGQRSAFHGACCEIDAMSRALNAGADLKGATMGVVTDAKTGAAVVPCASCKAVLKTLGVE